jgi:AcrR family transcriptional regulator
MLQTESPQKIKSVHERLLASGKKLFAANGFQNTTTSAIARDSGTSESQLIKYFQSKEGLLRAIFEDGWSRLAFVFSAASISNGPEESLRVIFSLIVKTLREDPELRDLMLFEGRRIRAKSSQVLLTDGYFRLVKAVEDQSALVLENSRLKDKVSPHAAASALIGMLESMLRDQAIAERTSGKSTPSAEEIRVMFQALIQSWAV